MSHRSTAHHAEPSRHSGMRAAHKARVPLPWMNNRVRRRWTRIAYVLIVLFVGALAALNLRVLEQSAGALGLRLPLFVLGFLALPLLYPLARRLGASRTTALWAMALLGACVPWLLLLRRCETCALMPLLLTLAALCYTRVLADKPGAWFSLGLTAAALFLDNPWVGLGLVLGLGLHAAGWVRARALWRALAWAGGVFLLGLLAVVCFPPLGGLPWNLSATIPPLAALLSYLLMLNAWVLPLLALPLLWIALFTDPAHRWRINPEAALPACIIVAVLLMAGTARAIPLLRIAIALAPLAALWLAMGFARLQARTPAWVWVPVGVLLVVTSVPHSLVRWGCQAVGLTRLVPDQAIATRLDIRSPELLIPLYPYVTREITLDGDGMEEM
jgi:hypothetical protein